ncbi:MAG: GNAT family N-acetyltransferase [Actinomycetota bacterium]|nr:GNAT family N-acetyltransferase [Actinomycetota bacterium]
MGEALGIYVAAMGYPQGTAAHRAPMWAEHMLRAGWQAVAAVGDAPSGSGTASAPLLGIGYGYRGARRQWWCEEVRSGLLASARSATAADALLDGYFELTELHVLPTAQGLGLGEQLLRRLLAERSERSVLLSTPEVPQERNRAWQLYRRLGFADVLRHFRFAGDGRPFAVLGRDLPL